MTAPDPLRLQMLLERLGWPHMVIGGLAVAARGTPRMTGDADVTVEVPEGAEAEMVARCVAAGFSPLPADPAEFVHVHRVLPVAAEDGMRVDLVVAGSPYESDAIGRATRVRVGDALLHVMTAEDLVIHKLVAGRPRDMDDARSVVRRAGPALDVRLIREVVEPLAAALADDDLRRRLREVLGG
ncbi:MAG: nucleotidyltransferase [Deltaproteobacteria bacterium]|nr:nucleotidyltransferase [Deltaproteobacteria bacterium]